MITEKNKPKAILKVELDKCFIRNIIIDEKRHIKVKKSDKKLFLKMQIQVSD